MERTITVRGTGTLHLKPDQIELLLEMQAQNTEYAAAMEAGEAQLEQLRQALTAEGYGRDDLRTTDFRISAEYDYQHETGSRVFRGYVCAHSLKLTLAFDAARLGRTLDAISRCQAQPGLTIRFTVADADAVNARLLQAAAENARARAAVLAEASGASLGQLRSISYSWGDRELFSPTNFAAEGAPRLAKASRAMDFTPEDITVSDNAVFVWDLE